MVDQRHRDRHAMATSDIEDRCACRQRSCPRSHDCCPDRRPIAQPYEFRGDGLITVRRVVTMVPRSFHTWTTASHRYRDVAIVRPLGPLGGRRGARPHEGHRVGSDDEKNVRAEDARDRHPAGRRKENSRSSTRPLHAAATRTRHDPPLEQTALGEGPRARPPPHVGGDTAESAGTSYSRERNHRVEVWVR